MLLFIEELFYREAALDKPRVLNDRNEPLDTLRRIEQTSFALTQGSQPTAPKHNDASEERRRSERSVAGALCLRLHIKLSPDYGHNQFDSIEHTDLNIAFNCNNVGFSICSHLLPT
jgi:hypothetical protein